MPALTYTLPVTGTAPNQVASKAAHQTAVQVPLDNLADRIDAVSAAVAAGNVFVSTAAGLAATSPNGYFWVRGNDDPFALLLYQEVAGVAVGGTEGLLAIAPLKLNLAKVTPYAATDQTGVIMWAKSLGGRRIPIVTNMNYDEKNNLANIGRSQLQILAPGDISQPRMMMLSPGGRRLPFAGGSAAISTGTVSDNGARYHTDAEIVAATAVVTARYAAINAQDMTVFPVWRPGFNIFERIGQSYAAGDGPHGVWMDAARKTFENAEYLAYSVGGDARSVGSGSTWDPFGGSAVLQPLLDRFIGATGTDRIFTPAEVAAGNYPSNARGGDQSAVAAYVFQFLLKQHFKQITLPTDRAMIFANNAKGEGLLAEILGTSGGANIGGTRQIDMRTKINTARTALDAAWAVQTLAVIASHGQADEAAGTAGYDTTFNTLMDAQWTDMQSKFTQTLRPPVLHTQVASKRGTTAMAAGQAQLNMALSQIGTNAYNFLYASTSEMPTLHNVGGSHVEAANDHPVHLGVVLDGIRLAIATFYIIVKRQPYFLPSVHQYWRDRDRGLLLVPNMTNSLSLRALPYGTTPKFTKNLGLLEQDSGGGDPNEIIDARIIPGTSLIELKFASSRTVDRRIVVGGQDVAGNITGQGYFGDDFKQHQPVLVRWNEDMRRFHNPLFGLGGDTGFGYQEVLGQAALNRPGYVNAVPGMIDCEFDLRNPVARGTVLSQTYP